VSKTSKPVYTYTIDETDTVEIWSDQVVEGPIYRQHRSDKFAEEENPNSGYRDWLDRDEAEQWAKDTIANLP